MYGSWWGYEPGEEDLPFERVEFEGWWGREWEPGLAPEAKRTPGLVGEIIALRRASDYHPHLDALGISRWVEYELSALSLGVDPECAIDELLELQRTCEEKRERDDHPRPKRRAA